MLIVMVIAEETVADGTQTGTALVVATLQAGQGLVVPLGMPEADGAQGMQILVNISEHTLMPFPGVAKGFTDRGNRETQSQVLETWDRQQVVVAVGSAERAADRPEGEEAVVHNVEGFGLVSEVVLSTRGGNLFCILGCIRIGTGLVGAGVVDKIIYTVYNVTEMSVTL